MLPGLAWRLFDCLILAVAVSDGTYTLTGLMANTSYMLNIVAQAASFRDGTPYTMTFTTMQEQLPVPTRIAITVDAAEDEMTVTVSWEAAAAAPATTYLISLDGGDAVAVSDSIYTLINLTAGRTYTLSIIARVAGFQDSKAYTDEFTTKIDVLCLHLPIFLESPLQ